MSAWIVSKATIDLLVQAMVTEGVVGMTDADETGRVLWGECLASVAARYPDDRDGERPGPSDFRDGDVDAYRFEGVEAPLCDRVVNRTIGCYWYQSCEHPAWETSEALKMCETLEAILVARHGGDPEFDSNETCPCAPHGPYARNDGLPWGVDVLADAVATSSR